jgi:hypothetical protein
MAFHPSPQLAQEHADRDGTHPIYLPARVPPTRCDHRNPCPDRPTRRLGRFTDRPWRCPQCARWWVTERHFSYAEPEGLWVWVRAEGGAS